MEPLLFFYVFISLIGICILLWMKTKAGKKWLKNL